MFYRGLRLRGTYSYSAQLLRTFVWRSILRAAGQRHHGPGARALAEYHVPVHLDVPKIDVLWTGIPDPQTPAGVRGIGEIGITGCAAAIANAIYNATGKRIRELPITPTSSSRPNGSAPQKTLALGNEKRIVGGSRRETWPRG